ncbi:Class II Aminoacyl-tRNA synthetase/Biotinyl protein ligase (BPL) and lipoyl protein ligase (LPL) [Septoria linicola]|nr:Class II Aminoacyl-tRNA synthetase/Biotinyl protein ligase (BPL) and lipoyl protein ligase (LPL) [Septoria linicola]
MPKEIITRRLRPYLFNGFKRSHFHFPTRALSSSVQCLAKQSQPDVTHDFEKRIAQLESRRSRTEWYPRIGDVAPARGIGERRISRKTVEQHGDALKPGETHKVAGSAQTFSLAGRISTIRTAGSKLVFVDIVVDDGTIQGVVQLSKLQEADPSVTIDAFKAFSKTARKGDSWLIEGHIHRTERGELSILAHTLPRLLSPSLHQIPESLEDAEARARNRHVDMLVNPEAIETLQVRHHVEAKMQDFFNKLGFVKVTTPLLSSMAGGATARPFETVATELSDETLNLRIAPELWLKRLIVGGMNKVYEIGPAFRNEGVDATHNPEFNICEYYQAYATLEDLMQTTTQLLYALNEHMHGIREKEELLFLQPADLNPADASGNRTLDWPTTLPTIEFIPTLEQKLNYTLPDLQQPDAHTTVLNIFHEKQLSIPNNPTLPRLLDALAAVYLEPLSASQPVFITHHPACMSPLSKHFTCPKTNQIIAARAELFFQGREYANMYEEENSPFEQRRKFEEQLKLREDGKDAEAMKLDEQYLRVLEWGMPPTGGWGCGVDRLVMLFSGRERMGDVLAFGTLRNVVGLGKV